jgi:hypothetical protein
MSGLSDLVQVVPPAGVAAPPVTPASPMKVQVDEYLTPGSYTWTKPTWAVMVQVIVQSGGGGGGSGRKDVAGTNRCGGGGGSAGGRLIALIPAADITPTVALTVTAGGAGGAAQSTSATSGIAGLSAGAATFGTTGNTILQPAGGTAGPAGALSAATASVAGQAAPIPGADGGIGRNAAGQSPGALGATPAGSFAAGGGGGGGVSATNLNSTGSPAAGPSISGSVVGSTAAVGTDGENATASTGWSRGAPGGGGGGGGGGTTGVSDSGAGGRGGDGFIRIVSIGNTP